MSARVSLARVQYTKWRIQLLRFTPMRALDISRSLVSGLRCSPKRVCGEERGLLSRAAAGNSRREYRVWEPRAQVCCVRLNFNRSKICRVFFFLVNRLRQNPYSGLHSLKSPNRNVRLRYRLQSNQIAIYIDSWARQKQYDVWTGPKTVIPRGFK